MLLFTMLLFTITCGGLLLMMGTPFPRGVAVYYRLEDQVPSPKTSTS
jgi:hypothetical protein